MPSKPTSQRTVYRALLVEEALGVPWHEYLRESSRADDGRDPVAGGAE